MEDTDILSGFGIDFNSLEVIFHDIQTPVESPIDSTDVSGFGFDFTSEILFEDNSSEITPQPDAIDPIAAGIEVYEVIPLVEDDDRIEFNIDDLTAEESKIYHLIKAYQQQISEETDNDIDIAELALKQNVDNNLFFTFSKDYLFKTPYDLSMERFKHEYQATRNPDYKYKKKFSSPFILDTEYQTYRDEYAKYFRKRKKLNLTVQIGGIHSYAPKNIYCHWDLVTEDLPLHFPALDKHDSCVFERYLRDNGYNVKFELKDSGLGEVEYLETSKNNVLQIPVFGHMLQADFMGFWQPNTPMHRYFQRIISGRDEKNNLDGKKRLVGESDKPELLRPRIIVREIGTDEKYALELIFFDSQSLHGIGKSLADLAKVTKTDILDDKDIYTKEQKERMLQVYLDCKNPEHRDNYRKYSVNSDLAVYQIFINNAKAFYNLYNDPEINAGKYFTLPKLTIGRCVADIITARILTKFEKDIFDDLHIINNEILTLHTQYGFINKNKKDFIKQLKEKYISIKTNEYERMLSDIVISHLSIKPPVKCPLEIFETVIKPVFGYTTVEDENGEVKRNKKGEIKEYIPNDVNQVSLKLPETLPKKIQQWIIDTFCGGSSAMNIAGLSDTRRLNAKIQGGRCFRNRPLIVKDKGVIIDPDFDGAYSSFMRALDLPMCANPFRLEYDLKKKVQLLTAEQFRNKYQDELIPGLYQFSGSYTDSDKDAINSPAKTLLYPQDLIPSYHPHKAITSVSSGASWLEKTDTSYVYTNQITNGIFTHWQLQIIDHIFSKELRKEILNSKVVTAIMYRKSDKVNTVRELLDGYRNYKGKDTYKIRGNKEIITRDSYRGWLGLNLGELIVTPIRKMRAKYPKKTAENEFYKLIGNTVYGVLCSKYFPVSNVVTANNITSGVRTGAWCLEKGLNSHGIVTDGGLANALTVAFGSRTYRLTDKNSVQTHRLNNLSKSVRYGIIGNYDTIEWSSVNSEFCSLKDKKTHDKLLAEGKTPEEIAQIIVSSEQLLRFSKNGITEQLDNNSARALMDNLIFNHLAEQFPKLDIFHADFTDDDGNPRKGILRIECKGIVEQCVLHGASNYLVRGGFHALYNKDKIKEFGDNGRVFSAMRSYRKGYGSHAQLFMERLGENPDMVERSEVFDQSILLKVGLYQERYRSYFENSDYQVGDTFFMERLIREFPFSAFTFQNAAQRDSWKQEETMMRLKYGQSIESLFVDDKGHVKFEQMIKAFDMWIQAGYTCLADALGDNKTAIRQMKMTQSHPEYESLKKRREAKRQAKR